LHAVLAPGEPSSSGMTACECGVPRNMNSAIALRSVISVRALVTVSLGSNLSSIETSSMRWP
jgi:hypothetical protein